MFRNWDFKLYQSISGIHRIDLSSTHDVEKRPDALVFTIEFKPLSQLIYSQAVMQDVYFIFREYEGRGD